MLVNGPILTSSRNLNESSPGRGKSLRSFAPAMRYGSAIRSHADLRSIADFSPFRGRSSSPLRGDSQGMAPLAAALAKTPAAPIAKRPASTITLAIARLANDRRA